MKIKDIIRGVINENEEPLDPNYIGSNIPTEHLDGMDNYDAGILYENVESVNQILRLSKFLLNKVAEKSYEKINETGHFEYLRDVSLSEISNNDFGVLNDFIKKEEEIYLHFEDIGLNDKEKTIGAEYAYPIITMYVYESHMVNMIYKLIKVKGNKITSHDLYLVLHAYCNMILRHELQHAYDQYRMGNKFGAGKEADEYNNDPENFDKYQNQPIEIWARFTEVFSYLKFYEPDGEMRPLRDILNDFSKYFEGYELLNEKTRRRLQAEVVKHWQQRYEELKKNKQ